jgi:hypothetical protein
MAQTNYLKNALFNAAYRNSAYTPPTTVYLAAYSVKPALDGSGGTELTGGSAPGYARVAVTFGAPTAGAGDNSAQIDLPANSSGSNWPEIVAWGICDALTVGNILNVEFFIAPNTRTPFTAVASTEIFTAPGHTFANGDKVVLKANSGLPAGVTAETIYFIIGVSGNTFQLSLTSGGAAINITTDGDGEIMRVVTHVVPAAGNLKINAGDLDIIL